VLDPGAGADYVDYRFELASGSYLSSYLRRNGPNPEVSTVETRSYRIGFADRWFETDWEILAGASSGVDVLEGNRNRFAPDVCVRSNATFAADEGAFVANIDGPVRAIRSYVGANSGPLTQRTHLLYRDHEEVSTDLRVHAIPGIMDLLDYGDGALGMSYHSSSAAAGVPIDRVPDPSIGTAVPTWEYVTGAQGSVLTAVRLSTNVEGGLTGGTRWFYEDAAPSAFPQCWGDVHATATHGVHIAVGIPNTDPRLESASNLRSTRINRFAPPGMNPTVADAWAAQIDAPLLVAVDP
jgi:hypothetical protein